MSKRYAGDPRWITARFGACAEPGCYAPLRNKRALYVPNSKQCFCEKHGQARMLAFEAAAADEAFENGQCW